jgi:hypothetical protein
MINFELTKINLIYTILLKTSKTKIFLIKLNKKIFLKFIYLLEIIFELCWKRKFIKNVIQYSYQLNIHLPK